MQQHRTRTAAAAIGKWPGILTALGVDERYLRDKHGPCPICGGRDRYRFDDKEGRGSWICSHCGGGSGMDLLMRIQGWDFAQAAKEVDRIIGAVPVGPIRQERSEEDKVQALRKVWKESRAVTKGDPVWTYLHRRIGIDVIPADLRFHPGLRHKEGGIYPAMLAKMTYPDGSGASIHRTYLTLDGHKAPVKDAKKFMPGKDLNTAAVRLGAVGRHLGIAEGIETALAASRRFGLPVWAATNAVLLAAWMPPAGIEEVLICADNDASYTGQSAAFSLARRLVRDGLKAEVVIPENINTDWADI